ncbi:FkbM family methyltransferase [Pelatocladus sp. BLCC-F211]|uniref:FkbM family methyltransferase n=1 Tax=Pelatocladus sp. BLCC-F211 TaxID=3342752 RepID=UPI0035BAA9DB
MKTIRINQLKKINMKLISYLRRPEYILRPIQIYRRIMHSFDSGENEFENVLLPWNIKIRIRPHEQIGRSIWLIGIYDLSVTEVLWRLIDRGETTIDIGSNIGYMTSIMAKQVGETGSVYCFEPHPEVYEELTENIRIWQASMGWHQINTYRIALSNKSGDGVLKIPADFLENRGTAALFPLSNDACIYNHDNSSPTYTVTLNSLDEFIKNHQNIENISVIKIDVEGHELEVLKGARKLINQQQIRDIVFEEHASYPSNVTKFLEENGYTIFRICKGFWGPLLQPPMMNRVGCSQYWEAPSYLATTDPSRAMKRMQKRGWNSLYGQD